MSILIAVEGPEGAGKTTQAALLHKVLLRAQGISVISTREPGGTAIGEQIRAILLDPKNGRIQPQTEVLLYSSARAQLVHQVILPALNRGDVVISDRYAPSTLAYQGYGYGMSRKTLKMITDLATYKVRPDLVVCLDLDVVVGLRRKQLDERNGWGEWNRMDQLDVAFHRRVRQGYLEMARQDPRRWLVIDATQPIGVIHKIIRQRVALLLEQSPRCRARSSRKRLERGHGEPWI